MISACRPNDRQTGQLRFVVGGTDARLRARGRADGHTNTHTEGRELARANVVDRVAHGLFLQRNA